jgi:AmmeMemoRadiSam system protein A
MSPLQNLPARSTPSRLVPDQAEYSQEERSLLLRLAHASIEAAVDGRELDLTSPTPHLDEQRGAFTTLYVRGQLHGCVGYVFPVASLYRTIAETARAAAFEDTRFPPMTKPDLDHLTVDISVLSPLRPIHPDDVEIGKHGLLVAMGFRRGLLLPQVPIEHGWDRTTFLEQTCRKAGLAPDAWQRGATLEAFTAEVFGGQEPRSQLDFRNP